MKKLLFKRASAGSHWVGDGFPVRSIFTYNDIASEISPFLLMDYAGPAEFTPAKKRRGVGEHPHRGFETVTIVYSGEVEHRDSAGGGGKIGPGDVQWMTAAKGVVHEEMHSQAFTEKGGVFEMVQLWVNLPAKDKLAAPRYQGLMSAEIPRVDFEGGYARVIAGEIDGKRGPALTFSPIELWDVRMNRGAKRTFRVPAGHTVSVFVLSGEVAAGGATIREAELGAFEREGEELTLTADAESKLLVLAGQPLNEPIVGYGPFVMNTKAQILEAFQDYQSGKMGGL